MIEFTVLLAAILMFLPSPPFLQSNLVAWNHPIIDIEQEAEPSDPESPYQEALELYNEGAYESAISLFELAFDSEEPLPEHRFQYADALLQAGYSQKAENQLIALIEDVPTYYDPYFSLGAFYFGANELDKALDVYTSLLDDGVYIEFAHEWRAFIYHRQGEYERAIEEYSAILALGSDNADMLAARANLYAFLDQNEAGLADYEQIIRLEPDQTRGYLGQFEIYLKQEAYADANDVLSKMGDATGNDALVLEKEAEMMQAQGDEVALLRIMRQRSRLEPDQAIHKIGIGEIYFEREQYVDAITPFLQAASLDPENAEIFFWLAKSYHAIDAYDTANDYFDQAIALDSDAAHYYCKRGYLLEDMGRLEDALVDFSITLETDPEHVAHLSNRARVHTRLGNFEAALADYNQILILEPDNLNALDSRAGVYLRQDNWEMAILDFDRIVEVYPDNPFSYHNRAAAHRSQGAYNAALDDYQEARSIDPQYARRNQLGFQMISMLVVDFFEGLTQ